LGSPERVNRIDGRAPENVHGLIQAQNAYTRQALLPGNEPPMTLFEYVRRHARALLFTIAVLAASGVALL